MNITKRLTPDQLNRKSVLIFIPHPDDMEFLVSHQVQYLISEGFQIFEVLFTLGAYGVGKSNKKSMAFKGKRIQKIRWIENINSKNEYGNFQNGDPHVISIQLDFIDGFIPFSKEVINILKKLILEISPTILLGPDPIYSIDCHPDHIAVGRDLYFAYYNLQNQYKPKFYFLYQTFKPNLFLPTQSWEIWKKVFSHHKSQFNQFNLKKFMFFIVFYSSIWGRFNSPLRRLNFEKRKNKIYLNWYEKIIYQFFFILTKKNNSFYQPIPSELELLDRNHLSPNKFFLGKYD